MIRRIIFGVPFLIQSPSFMICDAIDDGSAVAYCHLRFDGSRWLLLVEMKHGPRFTRSFASRNEAILAMGGQDDARTWA